MLQVLRYKFLFVIGSFPVYVSHLLFLFYWPIYFFTQGEPGPPGEAGMVGVPGPKVTSFFDLLSWCSDLGFRIYIMRRCSKCWISTENTLEFKTRLKLWPQNVPLFLKCMHLFLFLFLFMYLFINKLINLFLFIYNNVIIIILKKYIRFNCIDCLCHCSSSSGWQGWERTCWTSGNSWQTCKFIYYYYYWVFFFFV